MSISEDNSEKAPPRSDASFVTNIVIALIGAGATICGGYITYKLQEKSALCADFGRRYEKIDETNDSGKKLKRLKALVAENIAYKCDTYASAMHDLQELQRQITESITEKDIEPKVLTGHSTVDTDTITAEQFMPDNHKIDEAPTRTKIASLDETPPRPASATTGRSVAQDIAAAPSSPPIEYAANSPVLTVTPQSTSFEGRVGEKLLLRRDVSYALRPPQNFTTSYSVSGGDIIVNVDGKPHFHCKRGDTFRLYWRNTPDFFAMTHNRAAVLTVVGSENGAHLGISDCDPATG